MQEAIKLLNALANDKRLQVLEWLKDPTNNFPPQRYGDLVKDGVCSLYIAEKLTISQPTVSRHLNLLVDANLLKAKKIRQWTFYSRNETEIRSAKKVIRESL